MAAVLVIVLAATLVLTGAGREASPAPAGAGLVARVVDETGTPLPGLRVRLSTGGETRTGEDGDLRAALPGGAQLVTASADGHLPRTQAVVPGTPTEIRLTSAAEETVSIRFGGDVMFGRRFYDHDGDGDRSDGLLPADASAADHAALLAEVRPLLEDGDVTVVNFETAVADRTWLDPTGPRPPGFHPTKDVVFASSPASAQALVQSGVDVVSLGNNHVFNALEPGLEQTMAALDAAGLAHFGAGRTVDEAWAPAVVERKGQRVAFLGCTSVQGRQHAIRYVAGDGQGGAALCSTERLEQEVRAAHASADVVVVMIHGGEEYQAQQVAPVPQLSAAAEAAGAAVVVNGHPHVVGGVRLGERALIAETMGNLLFDQRVWPTFLSYLLRVDVRDGRPVLGTVDPLFIDDYLPRPTVGVLADAAARRAAGLTPGSEARLQAPGAVFTADDPPPAGTAEQEFPAGTVARLAPGWWVQGTARQDADTQVRVGEDLLWTGSFEDMDTDPATAGAHGWSLSPSARVSEAAACSGVVGVELSRSPVSTEDVIATPEHRQLVTPGTQLSLVAEVGDASEGARLELRWYPDTRGGSTSTTAVEIPAGSHDDACRQVRIDATVPDGIVAVQPMVRLLPTLDVQFAAHLAVDDVQLVVWATPGAFGRRYPVLDVQEDTTVVLGRDGDFPEDPVAGTSTSP
ncbi:poly-gamma-glutamate synthesis protein (capsule biosynthesis protein) [Geodermatophilus bullaregiensis]|uniref:CapA family protein n=1 Tax=Geodermatophilus bullaregiensis TaxID=1564160 RepID=UPI00195621A3|nr:CapA family protein [Geodermatophilus bullaregiensis]MBM7807973.1 poly-gamma-glutamate synthesis protein (capsule biosynthesis protein) [Geodermatophilus bullaregiensis]